MKMKAKLFKITAILLILAGSFWLFSCEKTNTTKDETTPLQGTRWKLAGIVNAETGVLTELEPKDCEECFTLAFDTDSTFNGRTVNNIVLGNYNANTHHITDMLISEASDTPEGELYGQTLLKLNSFTVEESYPRALHLWYNEGKNYLKYKETEGSNNEIPFTEYSLTEACWWENLLSDSLYLINSQEELMQHLACLTNVVVEVDFDKYSLMLLQPTYCNIDSKVENLGVQQVVANKYVLAADITPPDVTDNTSPLVISILVPKIAETAIVDLKVNVYKNNDDIAGDCLYLSFFEGIDLIESENKTTAYIIKGLNLGKYKYGLKIRLLEDLKGNFPENIPEFMVWGEEPRLGAFLNRVDVLSMYDKRDTLIMHLIKSRNMSEFVSPPDEWIERPEDYCTIECTSSVLKLSGDKVTGYIWPDVDGNLSMDTITWKDFQEELYKLLTTE